MDSYQRKKGGFLTEVRPEDILEYGYPLDTIYHSGPGQPEMHAMPRTRIARQ